jgi:putative ABC transport system permease protein
VAMVSFARGMSATFENTGSPDNVVVLQKAAFSQSLSSLPRSNDDVLRYYPHVARRGEATLASPELSVEPWVTVTGMKNEIFMVARGVEPVFFDVMDTVRVTQGTAALRGNKVLLGPAARHKLGGVTVGETIHMYGEPWIVAGLFEAAGSSVEFSILADLDDLMRAANREEYSSFTLKAGAAGDIPALVRMLEEDRRILVTAMPERDYYAASGQVFAIVARMGLLVAIIVSFGAVFGGMNTMYTAVAGRTREIGTLRALGFGGRGIMLSFVTEAVLIGLAGGVVGVGLGSLVDGARMNVMVASIQFVVTPMVAVAGLALSVVVGFLGGLPPALRAARLQVIDAIRHV